MVEFEPKSLARDSLYPVFVEETNFERFQKLYPITPPETYEVCWLVLCIIRRTCSCVLRLFFSQYIHTLYIRGLFIFTQFFYIYLQLVNSWLKFSFLRRRRRWTRWPPCKWKWPGAMFDLWGGWSSCFHPYDLIIDLVFRVVLLHDIARRHASAQRQGLIRSFGWEQLDHPPYTPVIFTYT